MPRVLVTGATGRVGREVAAQLASDGDVEVRALTRNPASAHLPRNVEAVRGDLTDAASLDAALAGVEAVFLVWTAAPDAAPAAIERIAADARRIVYLTAPHKTPHPFFQQPNAMAAMHARNEQLIEEAARAWTFLRPGMFAANTLLWWTPQLRHGDTIRWPYGDAPTAPIDERDIAAAAVRALVDETHAGGDYVLTGPESLTQREQVAILGQALRRPLRFHELTPEQARHELGFPPPVITMLLNAWSAALGQPAYVTSTVEELTGRRARTFREWAESRKTAFGC